MLGTHQYHSITLKDKPNITKHVVTQEGSLPIPQLLLEQLRFHMPCNHVLS